MTYREAVREAIRQALRKDDRVFLMGEDVGRYGGCFAVTKVCSMNSAPNGFGTRRFRNRRLLVLELALR